jgi:2-polyprenyl-6-methoxyphenol hydroxylase-like FAD-dependent oxidoreductase
MNDHEVILVGAGPTGLMLAGELALAGVDVAIVERRSTQEVIGPRARGVHARTIELFDQRGIADRFLSAGQTFSSVAFAWIRLEIGDLPTRHPYGLALPQADIERILADWIGELGVQIYRDHEVSGFAQDATGVLVEVAERPEARASFLVGCDGGRSRIRKAAGIMFPGSGPTISNLIAEVEMENEPPWGLRHDAHGVHSMARAEHSDRVQVLVTEPQVGAATAPTLADLSRALEAVYGTDYGAREPHFLSRFTDATRQAAAYRSGRVLLAGDAAHIHYPAGGQGLNLGLQDAVNLGWKLARVVKGEAPQDLLDTYQAEQHPVAERVLCNSMAQVALLGRLDDRKAALRQVLSGILALDEPRRRIGAMLSGLDPRYELGAGHPLLGRRMPDLDFMTAEGGVRVSNLLHRARPVVIDFAGADRPAIDPWREKVSFIAATAATEAWEIPAVGRVPACTALLVRPDGIVGWVEDANDQALTDALTLWAGPVRV